MALRRLFPAMRIDYTRVPGREWMEDPDRRYVNSIEIRAPLLQAIRRAQSAIVDDLPKGFSLPEGSLQRTDEPLIPLKVLREAIVNAVMHRDYRQNSPIHIIRYANRIAGAHCRAWGADVGARRSSLRAGTNSVGKSPTSPFEAGFDRHRASSLPFGSPDSRS